MNKKRFHKQKKEKYLSWMNYYREVSGTADAPVALKKYCKGATVGKGLAIHGADAALSESTVSAWAGKNLA